MRCREALDLLESIPIKAGSPDAAKKEVRAITSPLPAPYLHVTVACLHAFHDVAINWNIRKVEPQRWKARNII